MSDEWNITFMRAPLSPDPTSKLTPRGLRNANIGRSYWNANIAQIDDGYPYRAKLQKIIANIHVDERAGKGAIFYGNFGHGKTSSAVICMKAAMVRGAQAYLEPAVNVERAYEKTIFYLTPEGIQVWDMLTRCQFVTIDDLGNETVTSGYKAGDNRMVEALIRARYNDRLPTYITTNRPLEHLMKEYAGLATIFLDQSRYELVEVKGRNWRAGN